MLFFVPMIRFTTLFFFLLFFSTVLLAQTDSSSVHHKKVEITAVPYFNYNTTVGAGFGLVPMASFRIKKSDTISPRSNVGIVGVYRTNGAFALLTYGSLYFSEDQWRLSYAVGLNDKKFQTFVSNPIGDGMFVDYNTLGNFVYFDLKRRTYQSLFLGGGYSWFKYQTDVPNLGLDSTTTLSILSLDAFSDNRNSVYYPTEGSLFTLKYNIIPEFLGNANTSSTIMFNYNLYRSMVHDRDVFAARLHAKAGLGEIQFQQQPVIGGTDLRGYTNGKYRGDGVLDIQAEYRWNFDNPYYLSLVGFGGFATLYGSAQPDFDWKIYPNIGAGIRYTALKSNHMNVGIDFGLGKEDWGVYFRLSEAF